MSSQNAGTVIANFVQTIANHFKPHRAEALQRIRVNAYCLVTLLLISNLLPLPSLQAAAWNVFASARSERWAGDTVFKWFCILEVTLSVIFGFNIVEGLHAVKYPRAPLPPMPTPVRARVALRSPSASQKPFKVLSPHSSPQPQRPFSLSVSNSFSASTSVYPASPASSPSKTLHYSQLHSSTNTHASSTSSMAFMSTPSPVLSAYRGKHASSVGHALDSSILGRIPPMDVNCED